MRIGVDAASWVNGRGYGRFTREILRAMVEQAPDHTFQFFVGEGERAAIDLERPNVTFVPVRLNQAPTEGAAAGSRRSVRDMLAMTRAVKRERPDVFFSPTIYTYFPLPRGQRAVVTIHDVIPERFPKLTMATRRDRLFWALKRTLATWQARLVLTVSDHAARELHRVLRIPNARLRVTGEAPSPSYGRVDDVEAIRAAAERHGVPAGARWFTYVGGFNPHKRVDLVLEAHARLARDVDVPPHLLLVGDHANDAFLGNVEELRAIVRVHGTEALVHWLGFVPDADLAPLHAGARALLLVSEAEGYGLPAVEAAACRCPVIATRCSPLPEILEGGGLFVEPGQLDPLFDAMRTLFEDEGRREVLARQALERASALSWQRAGRAALDALEEACR